MEQLRLSMLPIEGIDRSDARETGTFLVSEQWMRSLCDQIKTSMLSPLSPRHFYSQPMRHEWNTSILTNAIALRPAASWLRWPCLSHEWIEIQRFDDLVCERCARCDKDRQWHLPIDLNAP